jgi:hypothetical protein
MAHVIISIGPQLCRVMGLRDLIVLGLQSALHGSQLGLGLFKGPDPWPFSQRKLYGASGRVRSQAQNPFLTWPNLP